LSVNYEIKGFYAPSNDYNITYPNTSEGVVFYRNLDELHVLVGNNGSPKVISVQLIADKPVSLLNNSLEPGDNLTIRTDSFNNQIINFDVIVGDDDLDEAVIITSERTLFSQTVIGSDNVYIGDKLIRNSCGNRGLTARQSSFQRYGLIYDDREIYPALLTGDVWWTS